jgi:hypothetical protein
MTTTPTPQTQTGYGVRAALNGYPVSKPPLTPAALAEAIRVQLRTWVVSAYGAPVPENPEAVNGPQSLAAMVARVVRAAEDFEEGEDDATAWGIAHLIHADADAIRNAHGYTNGGGYLLGCLYSVIVAGAYLWRDYDGEPVAFSPYPGDRPALDESALIETGRTLVQMHVLQEAGVVVPPRGSWLDAPQFSDLIADVADSFERAYGDMDGDDEIRALAHLVNAREHALKAGYGHGAAYVLACLNSLVLAVASMGHL